VLVDQEMYHPHHHLKAIMVVEMDQTVPQEEAVVDLLSVELVDLLAVQEVQEETQALQDHL
jgi:hypothetical protein